MDAVRASLLLILCVASDIALNNSAGCHMTKPTLLGGRVTLTCTLSCPREVIQKTWFKEKGNETKNVASWSEHGLIVHPEFSEFISILPPGPDNGTSAIEISKLEKDDEACYVCYFNIKHDSAIRSEICLMDIGTSNEVTCSATGTDIDIFISPEIETRKSKKGLEGNEGANFLRKGRNFQNNMDPVCVFFLPEAKNTSLRKQKTSREGSDGKAVLQCSVSGNRRLRIQWNENTTDSNISTTNVTHGNITTVTSTLQPHSLSLGQNASCSIHYEDNPENRDETAGDWGWDVVVLGVVLGVLPGVVIAGVAAAIFYFCRKHKCSSQNQEIQLKKNEETPTKVPIKMTAETPTENFGERRTENDGLPTHTNSYLPRKLEFDGIY